MTKDKAPPAYLYSRQYQHRLGVLARPSTKSKLPDDETLAELVKILTVKRVATMYGVMRSVIYMRLKRAGKNSD